MPQKIKSRYFDIYTNEIIGINVFNELYDQEHILKKFETKVTTSTHHPFATFLAEDRKTTNVKDKDFIVLRMVKNNKKFEFIGKISKWGKFSIPKVAIKTLKIKNHEKILFEIVRESGNNNVAGGNFIDLTKIKENMKTFYRENNYITLLKEYKTPITLPRLLK